MATTDLSDLNNGLIEFIKNSPTAFHAVKYLKGMLEVAGFTEVKEGDAWEIKNSGKYYVTRNDSALVAFKVNSSDLARDGFKIIGAHTDSPCFKVKPNGFQVKAGSITVPCEPYGGMLCSTWFDRDLSLAGRVVYKNKEGIIKTSLLDFKRPVAIIPNLAIHLNRGANDGTPINKQFETVPVMCQETEEITCFEDILIAELNNSLDAKAQKILDHEMMFYDSQAPQIVGLNSDYVTGARIDNLYSCFLAVRALIDSKDDASCMAILNDHEEVGSSSTSGAAGSFVKDVLIRLVESNEDYVRMVQNSDLISLDNAHAVHPNYADKHDSRHAPIINRGPVIKVNASQRYATNAITAAKFKNICNELQIPYQQFVARSDMGCGTTIGPITATLLGVKTLDIGLPTWGMHSIRETAGTMDAYMLLKVLVVFFKG